MSEEPLPQKLEPAKFPNVEPPQVISRSGYSYEKKPDKKDDK